MTKSESSLEGRLAEVYQVLVEAFQNQGYAPSVREIVARTSIKTTSHVSYCLERLEEDGVITRVPGISRSIQLTGVGEMGIYPHPNVQMSINDPVIRIQYVGPIAAGIAIHIPEATVKELTDDNTVEIPASLLPPKIDPQKLFVLKVKGDSMLDALVGDGDLVILTQPTSTANGDMVAAWLVEEHATTLKYFYRDGKRIRLQPANPQFEPMYVDQQDLLIQGKVLAVHRQLW